MASDKIRRKFRRTGPGLGMIYGPIGTGKTSGALSFPDPVVIPVEDGQPRRKIDGKTPLEVDKYPQPKTFEEFLEYVNDVAEDEDNEFKTLIIDTADRLEPLIWDYVCRAQKVDSIEDVGGGYGRGYAAAATEWLGLINLLRDLVTYKAMHVIILAHASATTFTPPGLDSFSRWAPRLHKGAAAVIMDECDYVGFLNFSTAVSKTDGAFGKTEKKGVSGDIRTLSLEYRASADAKSREGMPNSVTIKPKQELYPLLEEYFA